MSDISPENVARVSSDCRLAAKVMADLGTFETGQGILAEVADTLEALSARLAEVEAANRELGLQSLADLGQAQDAWEAQKAAEAENAKLREALIDHNDLLRSAMQIAKREGVEGEIGSTNWDAYYNRVAVVLKRHHETANTARGAP